MTEPTKYIKCKKCEYMTDTPMKEVTRCPFCFSKNVDDLFVEVTHEEYKSKRMDKEYALIKSKRDLF